MNFGDLLEWALLALNLKYSTVDLLIHTTEFAQR